MSLRKQDPPVIYGYTRVSTLGQAEDGLSLPEQEESIKTFALGLQKQDPGLSWGAIYSDRGKSAWKHDWRNRPEGDVMFRRLKAGDHLIVKTLDRAFRNMRDCAATIEHLEQRGVHLHILQFGVDSMSPVGKLIMHVLAAVAQFESDMKSMRIREVKAFMAERGIKANQNGHQGFKQARRGNKKVAYVDWEERREMSLIRTLYDAGVGRDIGSDEIERMLSFIENRKKLGRESGRKWSPWRVRKCYLQFAERLDIGPIDDFFPTVEHILQFEDGDWEDVHRHYVYRTWLDEKHKCMTRPQFIEWAQKNDLGPEDMNGEWWEDTFGGKLEFAADYAKRRAGIYWK